jgi:CheY-like chemotaxis protein
MEKPYTVLAVDDENDMLLITRMTLQDAGYRVLTALDGMHALESARRDKPDLILLDVLMPGMNGFEVLERLRQDESTRNMPVVIVSVLTERERTRLVMDEGIEYYLVKPFDRQDLLDKVRRAIEGAEGRKA